MIISDKISKFLLLVATLLIVFSCEDNKADWNGTVTDIDGNVYKTVRIGDQWWMAENLRTTSYRNGDAVPNITDFTEWTNLDSGAYCNYNNDVNKAATYGSLYNWYAVDDSNNITPEGWHVPSDGEWQVLVNYLGGIDAAGRKMKETGTTHWCTFNIDATNESGFTALPSGCLNLNGDFYNLGYGAYFWSSDVWPYTLLCNYSGVYGDYFGKKQSGYSVRCVRD
ncbi:MAG: fibrobacter succinogenes major paralogous domain-containing protein [Candidatus Marinimicrobia bacterium]|nr:fibrobacter succinogenes major paralogous domain-containing protein [Candidatus Neomarinimicrobiota bacterium]